MSRKISATRLDKSPGASHVIAMAAHPAPATCSPGATTPQAKAVLGVKEFERASLECAATALTGVLTDTSGTNRAVPVC